MRREERTFGVMRSPLATGSVLRLRCGIPIPQRDNKLLNLAPLAFSIFFCFLG